MIWTYEGRVGQGGGGGAMKTRAGHECIVGGRRVASRDRIKTAILHQNITYWIKCTTGRLMDPVVRLRL